MSARRPLLDLLRGTAVLWMIIFHFAYDLRLFGWPTIPTDWSLFWWAFPRIIVACFLAVMGAAWVQARKREKDLRPFIKRLLKLSGAALAVSVATYLLFPERWVYFGTLHCIAVSSVCLFVFEKKKWLQFLAIALIIASEIFGMRPPWIDLPHPSMDYIPLFPWLGFAILGMLLSEKIALTSLPESFIKASKPVIWLGRNSLKIYLLHQPFIFGALWSLSQWPR